MTTDTLKICIAGIAGRMGRQLARAALDRGHHVSGGYERSGSPHLGEDIGVLIGQKAGIGTVSEDASAAMTGADLVIDFTAPAATLASLQKMATTGVRAAVIGTTGFTPDQEAGVAAFADRLAIVKSGNFSLGINLLEGLVKLAAERLGEDWDIEISETHHRHKKDAPSGTALMLGEAAASGRGGRLDALRTPPYDGPDARREPGRIGFAVQRLGGVIGEHAVTFGSQQEVLTLSHTALDRAVFAHGAIWAAEWAASQTPGLYDMGDVLDL